MIVIDLMSGKRFAVSKKNGEIDDASTMLRIKCRKVKQRLQEHVQVGEKVVVRHI
jgi:hypothetical protein